MKIKLGLSFFLIVLAGLLWVISVSKSTDSGSWMPVSGTDSYYSRADYEGFILLGYSSGWFSSPELLLGEIDGFAKAGNLLIVRKSEPMRYFLYNADAPDLASAKASFVGPLHRSKLNPMLVQQAGDSTIHFSPFP
ncbi:hypothetical protein [Hymenobacter algoricola]|uniref:DUF4350 domain-containing protein n=1 Tax=Hymenobacter algoricola TaxID=486267 RepID=A0ABP7MP20_9BACT